MLGTINTLMCDGRHFNIFTLWLSTLNISCNPCNSNLRDLTLTLQPADSSLFWIHCLLAAWFAAPAIQNSPRSPAFSSSSTYGQKTLVKHKLDCVTPQIKILSQFPICLLPSKIHFAGHRWDLIPAYLLPGLSVSHLFWKNAPFLYLVNILSFELCPQYSFL